MGAMTRLARELRHKCADAGVAVEIDSSITDLVWAVCDPLSGTERMNFRNQSEGFEPNELVDSDVVQTVYLDVTVTEARFEAESRMFRPKYMILTPPLMAYLKLLVMENYGLFNFEGDTEQHDRFPKNFFYHLQTELQEIGDRKLVTFKGRVLMDAAWVVTPQFKELWDDEDGLSAMVDEETKDSLLARQAESAAAHRHWWVF